MSTGYPVRSLITASTAAGMPNVDGAGSDVPSPAAVFAASAAVWPAPSGIVVRVAAGAGAAGRGIAGPAGAGYGGGRPPRQDRHGRARRHRQGR